MHLLNYGSFYNAEEEHTTFESFERQWVISQCKPCLLVCWLFLLSAVGLNWLVLFVCLNKNLPGKSVIASQREDEVRYVKQALGRCSKINNSNQDYSLQIKEKSVRCMFKPTWPVTTQIICLRSQKEREKIWARWSTNTTFLLSCSRGSDYCASKRKWNRWFPGFEISLLSVPLKPFLKQRVDKMAPNVLFL